MVVDEALLHQNIAEMAALAASLGVAPRPHAKTHKSPHIARLQLAAGNEMAVVRDGHVIGHWPVAARCKVR